MSKISLQDINSFQNDSTAVAATTANNTILENAVTNTLSRDGTQPNTMSANLDLNNNRILNLPAAVTSQEPMRLQDLANYATGGTVTLNNLPVGGTTGQFLQKASNTNYDFNWNNIPTNQAVTSFNTNSGVVTYNVTSTDLTVVNTNNNATVNLTTARKTLPTQQIFTSGSGTYTTPSNCLYIKVTLVGGGGGGGGSSTVAGSNGIIGGNTTFSTFTANGGAFGTGGGTGSNAGGAGGTASGGKINALGNGGLNTTTPPGATNNFAPGLGGNGQIGTIGAGGTGGSISSAGAAASGGGAGAMCIGWINSPAATYSYAVGAGGAGGAAGTGGNTGGNGNNGIVLVEEFYNS